MFQILDFSATCSGQIPTRMFKVGARMIVVYPSHLVRKLSPLSTKSTILIWSAEHIRSLRTVMNSSLRDSLSHCSPLQTIAESLITQEPWCQLTIHSCAASKSSNLLKRSKSSHMAAWEQADLSLHPGLSIEKSIIVVYKCILIISVCLIIWNIINFR